MFNNKIKRFISRLEDALLGESIWEAIKHIGGTLSAAGLFALFGERLSTAILFLRPIKIYLVIFLFILGIVTIISYLLSRSKYHAYFPRFDFDFEILEKEITLEYIDKTSINYKKRLKLRSLKDKLDTYNDKYHWTGDKDCKIQSLIIEHQVRQTYKRNVWQFYEVKFQRHLEKREEVEIELLWSLTDLQQTFVPFISTTIEEPTAKLILNLILPKSLGVSEVVCDISSLLGAKKPIKSACMKFDRNNKIQWVLEDKRAPKLLRTYEIRWVFN